MNETTKAILREDKDPYNRQQRLLNIIDNITNGKILNDVDEREQKLTPKNKELLLGYNATMEKQYLKKNNVGKRMISIGGWEKSLACAYQFAEYFQKNVDKLNRKDIEKWFGFHEQRLMDGKITSWTLDKAQQQARKFLRFVLKLEDHRQYIKFFDWTRKLIPKPEKNTVLASDLPSQEDVQKLLVTLRNQGNRTSILYAAVVSLANDSGARISEILSIRNKDVKEEQGFLVITLPKSKTNPRTIISILSKQYMNEWDRVSPNQGKPNELFFCNSKGEMIRYNALRKFFNLALKEANLEFPKGKALHFFRKMFASRCYEWSTTVRNYWLGWSSGISDVYTSLSYKACIEPYLTMLKKEANPMLGQVPSWENEAVSEQMLDNFLGSEVGKMALKQWAKKMNIG